MKFMSFTSGSCGNCCYLGTEPDGTGRRHALIIDAGASMRRVRRIMADNRLSIDEVEGILVTHDHLDHIRFLGTFCKYMHPAVYTSDRIHGALAAHTFTRDHIAACRRVLEEGEWNIVSDWFAIKYFTVPHDATQTIGFAVRCHENGGALSGSPACTHRFVLMTDMDHVTDEAMELASQADTVVIESNYDYDMLINGPYTAALKKRILNEGHMCNSDTADAIRKFYHPGLRNLFLCHLSGNNNTPELAYGCAAAALADTGAGRGAVQLRTLARGVPSPLLNL